MTCIIFELSFINPYFLEDSYIVTNDFPMKAIQSYSLKKY